MSEYFVAANTRTSFTDLAESTSTNPLGAISTSSPSNMNSSTMHTNQSDQSFAAINNLPGAIQKPLNGPQSQLAIHQIQNQHPNGNHQNLHAESSNNSNINPTPMNHSSASSCNQNHYHYHNHDHPSSASMHTPRLSQPTRTQIPIHCYIEQLDACADVPGYQSPLTDNDLFITADPTKPTHQQNQTSNNHHQPHLHQSKLALESVTNGSIASLSSLAKHSNSLFSNNDPTNPNDSNDLDNVDANLDHLDSDSPLSIHPPQTNSTSTNNASSSNNLQQTSSSIYSEPLDNRHNSPYYESNHQFSSCKETYVIVTSNVLYIDLVRTVLLQLGYSAMDLINAKGKLTFIDSLLMMAGYIAFGIPRNPSLARKEPGMRGIQQLLQFQHSATRRSVGST